MRKCLALFLALFLCFSTTVSAAPTGNWLTHSNGYSYSLGGGTSEYVIPYTGYYDISLAGSQGSAYNSNSGGKGYVLSKKVYLNKGDVIKVVIGERPSWSQNGSVLTVPGGNCSELYLNGVLQWRAGGGASEQSNNIAPTGVTSVQYLSGNPTTDTAVTLIPHWHTGNGMSGPTHANQFPTLFQYNDPGGHYVCAGHKHGVLNCEAHEKYKEHGGASGSSRPCPICGRGMCGEGQGDSVDGWITGGHGDGTTTWSCSGGDCDDMPNTWRIGCGWEHGEIRGSITTTAGTCYTIPSGVFASPSATLSQEGNGVFACSLSPQGTIGSTMYGEHPIAYKGTKAELVLVDKEGEDKDYVAYFRR